MMNLERMFECDNCGAEFRTNDEALRCCLLDDDDEDESDEED